VLLNDPILRQKAFLGPQWSKKQFQTMGFIFQRQLGVFGPTTGSVATYAYVAGHLTMALKKSIFQVGLL
jgi:hypothetical protein